MAYQIRCSETVIDGTRPITLWIEEADVLRTGELSQDFVQRCMKLRERDHGSLPDSQQVFLNYLVERIRRLFIDTHSVNPGFVEKRDAIIEVTNMKDASRTMLLKWTVQRKDTSASGSVAAGGDTAEIVHTVATGQEPVKEEPGKEFVSFPWHRKPLRKRPIVFSERRANWIGKRYGQEAKREYEHSVREMNKWVSPVLSRRQAEISSASRGSVEVAPVVASQLIDTITQEEFNALLTRNYTRLCEDYWSRRRSGSLEELAKGPCFANDYYRLLKEKIRSERNPGKKRELESNLRRMRESGEFLHGRPPKGMTLRVDEGSIGGYHSLSYEGNPYWNPADIVREMTRSSCFVDSKGAFMMCVYQTLLEVMGDFSFNQVYSRNGNGILISHTMMENLTAELFSIRVVSSEEDVFREGEFYAALQHLSHSLKELNGDLSVLRCLRVREGRFMAFGVKPNATEDEIFGEFVTEYNRDPVNGDIILPQWWNQIVERKGITKQSLYQHQNDRITLEKFPMNERYKTRFFIVDQQAMAEKFHTEREFKEDNLFGQAVVDVEKVRKLVDTDDDQDIYIEELVRLKTAFKKREEALNLAALEVEEATAAYAESMATKGEEEEIFDLVLQGAKRRLVQAKEELRAAGKRIDDLLDERD